MTNLQKSILTLDTKIDAIRQQRNNFVYQKNNLQTELQMIEEKIYELELEEDNLENQKARAEEALDELVNHP